MFFNKGASEGMEIHKQVNLLTKGAKRAFQILQNQQIKLGEQLDKLGEGMSESIAAGFQDTGKELGKKISLHNMSLENLLDDIEDLKTGQEKKLKQLDSMISMMDQSRYEAMEQEKESLIGLIAAYQEQFQMLSHLVEGDSAWERQLSLIDSKLAKDRAAAKISFVGMGGDLVDLDLHEIINVEETEDSDLEEHVAEVYSPGCLYNGKVWRKAKICAYRYVARQEQPAEWPQEPETQQGSPVEGGWTQEPFEGWQQEALEEPGAVLSRNAGAALEPSSQAEKEALQELFEDMEDFTEEDFTEVEDFIEEEDFAEVEDFVEEETPEQVWTANEEQEVHSEDSYEDILEEPLETETLDEEPAKEPEEADVRESAPEEPGQEEALVEPVEENVQEPDFVQNRIASEDTSTALEPSRQVEREFLEETSQLTSEGTQPVEATESVEPVEALEALQSLEIFKEEQVNDSLSMEEKPLEEPAKEEPAKEASEEEELEEGPDLYDGEEKALEPVCQEETVEVVVSQVEEPLEMPEEPELALGCETQENPNMDLEPDQQAEAVSVEDEESFLDDDESTYEDLLDDFSFNMDEEEEKEGLEEQELVENRQEDGETNETQPVQGAEGEPLEKALEEAEGEPLEKALEEAEGKPLEKALEETESKAIPIWSSQRFEDIRRRSQQEEEELYGDLNPVKGEDGYVEAEGGELIVQTLDEEDAYSGASLEKDPFEEPDFVRDRVASEDTKSETEPSRQVETEFLEEPDFVRGCEAGETTKSASEPSRQVETGLLEEEVAPAKPVEDEAGEMSENAKSNLLEENPLEEEALSQEIDKDQESPAEEPCQQEESGVTLEQESFLFDSPQEPIAPGAGLESCEGALEEEKNPSKAAEPEEENSLGEDVQEDALAAEEDESFDGETSGFEEIPGPALSCNVDETTNTALEPSRQVETVVLEEPDFVRDRVASEITNTALEPSRQVENVVIEEVKEETDFVLDSVPESTLEPDRQADSERLEDLAETEPEESKVESLVDGIFEEIKDEVLAEELEHVKEEAEGVASDTDGSAAEEFERNTFGGESAEELPLEEKEISGDRSLSEAGKEPEKEKPEEPGEEAEKPEEPEEETNRPNLRVCPVVKVWRKLKSFKKNK